MKVFPIIFPPPFRQIINFQLNNNTGLAMNQIVHQIIFSFLRHFYIFCQTKRVASTRTNDNLKHCVW